MNIDRRRLVQILIDTRAEAATLLAMAAGKGLEFIENLAINVLAMIGVGAISFAGLIGYLFGWVELGDLIPLD